MKSDSFNLTLSRKVMINSMNYSILPIKYVYHFYIDHHVIRYY